MIVARAIAFAAALLFAIAVNAPLQWALRRVGWTGAADRLQIAVSRLLCAILRLQVHVAGSLAPARPALVVSNHVSWTDILVLGSQAPFCFVAKSDVAHWPLIGPAIRAHGTLFVPRTRTRAMGAVNKGIAGALGQGRTVVLFPEGTTGNGSRLEPFHSGHLAAAHDLLAADPSCPAVHLMPAALAYTRHRALPAGRTDRTALAWFGDMPLLPHVLFLLRHGPIRCDLVWGDPLAMRRDDDRKVVTAAVRERVRQAFSRLIGGTPAQLPEAVHRPPPAVWSPGSMPAPTRAPSGSSL